MKHSIKEIKEKNQTTVTVAKRRGGGGGGSHCIPCSDKWYPFHIPNCERYIPF